METPIFHQKQTYPNTFATRNNSFLIIPIIAIAILNQYLQLIVRDDSNFQGFSQFHCPIYVSIVYLNFAKNQFANPEFRFVI